MKRLFALLLSVCFLLMTACSPLSETNVEQAEEGRRLILLDPGHGGIDGGAVASDGVAEKGINLEISLRLKELLIFMGYDVIMTRETDVSVHDADATTIRQIKSSDLHNRLKLASEHPEAAFISIHQNNFSDTSQDGMCFYYSPNNPQSEALAESFHQVLLSTIQPQNRRQIKAAGSNLFIMKNAVNPAVLVECGFLSNRDEEQKLLTQDYQQQLCGLLLVGLSQEKL